MTCRSPSSKTCCGVNFSGRFCDRCSGCRGCWRGCGQIIGLVSLTAICPLPLENAYKRQRVARRRDICRACGLRSRRRGIHVVSVFPGFVRTPLLFGLLERTGSKMPLGSVSAEEVARRIVVGISGGRRVVGLPRRTVWPVHLTRLLPAAIVDWAVDARHSGPRFAALTPFRNPSRYQPQAAVFNHVPNAARSVAQFALRLFASKHLWTLMAWRSPESTSGSRR